MEWLGARDAAKRLKIHRPTRNNKALSAPDVNNTEGENPAPDCVLLGNRDGVIIIF